MISCVEWVPSGIANPNPKRYEYSQIELDAMKEIEQNRHIHENNNITEEENDDEDDDDDGEKNKKENEENEEGKLDSHGLPVELRMDEYGSDDDENNENNEQGGMLVGQLLIGKDMDIDDDNEEEDVAVAVDDITNNDDIDDHNNNREKKKEEEITDQNDNDIDSNDSDDDDDLADVPDTREYMPINMDGLRAMGLSSLEDGGAFLDNHYDDLKQDDDDDDDDASDVDDVNLRPDDALILVAKTDQDFASLEVLVYEQSNGNLYVHHDIPLPSFPLCLAHGTINPSSSSSQSGNYCAVGTFDSAIEIWNLDVLNVLEPTTILGGRMDASPMAWSSTDWIHQGNNTNTTNNNNKKKKKKKKNNKKNKAISDTGLQPGSHSDAVMSLSWNTIHKEVIASGSADCTVKLWDVTRAPSTTTTHTNNNNTTTTFDPSPVATFTHHTNKVQSVMWHPTEGTILATGSYDKTVSLIDVRSTSSSSSLSNRKTVTISADCETLAWDPYHVHLLTIASEDGIVVSYDVRNFDNGPIWSFCPHGELLCGSITDLAYNPNVPGMLATCSIDKTVALWDTHHHHHYPSNINNNTSTTQNQTTTTTNNNTTPYSCGNRDMKVGKLFTTSFYPSSSISSSWLIGCGGSGNQVALWDLSNEKQIQNHFKDRVLLMNETKLSLSSDVDNDNEEEEVIIRRNGGDTIDFEAAMIEEEETEKGKKSTNNYTTTTNKHKNKNKKKKGKGKKKVHKKGR